LQELPCNPPTSSSQTFTCFPKLPFEIRHSIWEFAAFLPRNIDIWAKTLPESEPDELGRDQRVRFLTTQPPPAILSVNSEAHTIGLRYYQLEFHRVIFCGLYPGRPVPYLSSRSILMATTEAKIYINYISDRICPMGPFDEPAGFLLFRRIQGNDSPNVKISPRPWSLAINLALEQFIFGDYGALWEGELLIYHEAEAERLTPAAFKKPVAMRFIPFDNGSGRFGAAENSLKSFQKSFYLMKDFYEEEAEESKRVYRYNETPSFWRMPQASSTVKLVTRVMGQ
jgi:hypothetical protein